MVPFEIPSIHLLLTHQVSSFTKFCPSEARETSQVFPGIINKIQGLSRTAKKSMTFSRIAKKQSWTFPGCGNTKHICTQVKSIKRLYFEGGESTQFWTS